MFEKFKNEDTDPVIPVTKEKAVDFVKPPTEEKTAAYIGRRMITSEDQKEVKKRFSEMIEKDPEIAISCTSCDIYLSLIHI